MKLKITIITLLLLTMFGPSFAPTAASASASPAPTSIGQIIPLSCLSPECANITVHIEEQGWAGGCQSYKTTLPFTLKVRYWEIFFWDEYDYTIYPDCYGNVQGQITGGENGASVQWWLKGLRWTAAAGSQDGWEQGIFVNALYNASTNTDLAGDADNSNLVNLIDYTILHNSYGFCYGSPGYDNRADFDMNDCVGANDFTYVHVNFGHSGPASW